MNEMVEVVIDSIRVGLMSQNRVIILREVEADRFLAIWIDPYMAEQITFALQEVEVARPMSHDLLKQVLQNLNARLLRVEVLDLKNEVFFGNLVIETDSGHTLNIDSRPSDALALAVRANVPILVANKVMEDAGIIPEDDISLPDTEEGEVGERKRKPPEPAESESGEHLSIFEDFLDSMDLDQEDPPNDEDPQKT
ncbi:MAG: bifunctional nuclease family protein [Chloroflexota bacterium]